jgi:AcrR family transcriptional regulator
VTALPQPPAARRGRTDVRARVLQAAVRLVHERGLQAVTQARVAASAGLRQSHVTYYFPARIDLLKAIVQENVSSLLDGVGSTGMPSLGKFRDTMIERLKSRDMPRMVLALLLASDEDPALRAWLRTFDRDFRAQLRQLCRANDLNPTSAGIDDFHCTLIGAAMLGMHDDNPQGMRRAVRTLRKAFERLIHDARRLPARGARRA